MKDNAYRQDIATRIAIAQNSPVPQIFSTIIC